MALSMEHPAEESVAEQPSVLVVDDAKRVADLYARFLEDEYVVTTAYGGEAALEVVDGSFDVVLLDRRMPEVTGDEVLETIRSRNLGCRVAMLTAVDPDFDIVDMAFEEYVVKPVSRDDLCAVVERLVLMSELEDVEYELSSLRVKRNVLRAELREAELAGSEEFARLQERIDELHGRLSEVRTRLADSGAGALTPA